MDDVKGLLDEKGIESATLRRLFGAGAETVYAVTRPGAGAVEAWRALRDALAGRGWWPVILGAEEGLRRIGEDFEFNLEGTSPRSVLERGLSLSPEAWLAERGADGDGPDECEWSDEIEIAPNDTFTVALDVLTRKPFARVAIAIVPAAAPWEVPAYLGIGGWNDCPNPEAHVALMRRWHERYGAEIVGYTGDVVELGVARPVRDPDEARELAREQYAYCTDIVDQGVGTMEALAATLAGSTVWYFGGTDAIF